MVEPKIVEVEIYECSIEGNFKAPNLGMSSAVTNHDLIYNNNIDPQNLDSVIRLSTGNAKRNYIDKSNTSSISNVKKHGGN